MKITNKIVNKLGADRILHFLACACVVLAGGYIGEVALFVSFVVAVVLSVLKEYVFDDREDGNDADAVDCYCGFAGALFGVLWYILFAVVWTF